MKSVLDFLSWVNNKEHQKTNQKSTRGRSLEKTCSSVDSQNNLKVPANNAGIRNNSYPPRALKNSTTLVDNLNTRFDGHRGEGETSNLKLMQRGGNKNKLVLGS